MNVSLRPATLQALTAFRARRRKLLQWRAGLALALVALIALLVLALLDRAWFLPDAVRPWATLAAYAGALFTAWRVAWRHLREAREDDQAARLIESAAPHLREKLLAAVELARSPGSDSEEFRALLQDHVANEVEKLDLAQALPARSLKPWALATAGGLLLCGGLGFVPSLHVPGFMARAALPFLNLARPSSVKIQVVAPSPANTLVPVASEQEIAVEIEGETPSEVILETKTSGGSARKFEMSKVFAGRYEVTVPVGQDDLSYRVRAADGLSSWYTLEARPRPRVVEFVKTVIPPAYTGQPETQVTEEHGDIEALEGSTIRLALKPNQPLQEASLQLNPEHADRPAPVPAALKADGALGVEFVVKPELEAWRVDLVAKETGFNNEESSPARITCIPDLPPVAQLMEPQQPLELIADETVRVEGLAGDDVGLASIKLAHAINGAAWQEKEVAGKSGLEAAISHNFVLAPLQLQPGDTVLLKWIVTDLKGQTSESQQARLIILEQTVDPRQRVWARETRRLAQQAATLSDNAQELRKAVEAVKKSGGDKNPQAKSDDALARAETELQKVREQADDLWNQLKQAAQAAPTRLDAMEVQMLGDRLSHMRRDALPELQAQLKSSTAKPDQARRAASDAASDANALAEASRAFAAEENARVLSQAARQLHRQEALLTTNSLNANRDAAMRPQWQEQQKAAIAATETLKKEMQAVEPLVDGGQQHQLRENQKLISEAAADLTASLDKPGQNGKSAEHLYGAADNLQHRLRRAADAAQAMADTAGQKAARMREQFARRENPAVEALAEARSALARAADEAKDTKRPPKVDQEGLLARDRAEKELELAARHLEDQGVLKEQNALTHDEASLDNNRASRAADQQARELAAAPAANAPAMEQLKQKAEQLTEVVRALEAGALAQNAVKAGDDLATEADPAKATNPTRPADHARAAAESLQVLPEALRRMRSKDPQMTAAVQQTAAAAQQAAASSRAAADQLQALARQTAQNPGQPANAEPAMRAAQEARDRAAEVAAMLETQTAAARESLAQMTPDVSDMMKAVAKDLEKTRGATEAAAKDAQAAKPVDQVAQQAGALEAATEKTSEKIESLQAALRQEANAADLQSSAQRQMARTADVALAQLQQKTPQISQHLKQAAQATQSQPQAQNLTQAAQAQQQAAQALDQLATNMQKVENGGELSEQELAAMKGMEQELGVQEALDEAYQRAQQLAEVAQDAGQDPAAVLAELEKELPKNPAMQKALAELSKETAHTAEKQVTEEANMPSNIGLATEQAGHDLARVARHQQRLGQEEAARVTAAASSDLAQQAQRAKGQPGQQQKPVDAQAQATATQAAKAAEASAAATPPASNVPSMQQIQGALLAQALDQLDATVHPRLSPTGQQGQEAAQPGEGQQGNQQQQAAQQSLAAAQKSQQQQMADQRNQGQTPGGKQPGQANQTAQNQQQQSQQSQSNAASQNDGGDLQAQLRDGQLAAEGVLARGDWGHLPSKMAEDLTEATRSEAAPEYRAAIESYYKAIATKAKR